MREQKVKSRQVSLASLRRSIARLQEGLGCLAPIALGAAMPHCNVPSLPLEPETLLLRWQVMAIVPDGTFHFVGQNSATGDGRVSSAIQEFDSRTGKGRTFSGRRYRLIGDRGYAGVAQRVWAVWCRRNNVAESIDVTHMYEPESGYDYSL